MSFYRYWDTDTGEYVSKKDFESDVTGSIERVEVFDSAEDLDFDPSDFEGEEFEDVEYDGSANYEK